MEEELFDERSRGVAKYPRSAYGGNVPQAFPERTRAYQERVPTTPASENRALRLPISRRSAVARYSKLGHPRIARVRPGYAWGTPRPAHWAPAVGVSREPNRNRSEQADAHPDNS